MSEPVFFVIATSNRNLLALNKSTVFLLAAPTSKAAGRQHRTGITGYLWERRLPRSGRRRADDDDDGDVCTNKASTRQGFALLKNEPHYALPLCSPFRHVALDAQTSQ